MKMLTGWKSGRRPNMRTVKKSFVKTTLATFGKLVVDVVMTSGRVYCPVGAVGIEGKDVEGEHKSTNGPCCCNLG